MSHENKTHMNPETHDDDLEELYRGQRELREKAAADWEEPPNLATQVMTTVWFGLGIILGGLLLAFGVLTVYFFVLIAMVLLMVSLGLVMCPNRIGSALGRGMLVSAGLALVLFLFVAVGSR